MLTHKDIWAAIDQLAARNGLSASGLAKRAGLDPTTFNKSKRATKDGRARWPTTESLSKVLDATDTTIGNFLALLDADSGGAVQSRIPVIGFAQAGEHGYFDDDGLPAGDGWDEVLFPDLGDGAVFGLEINGDSMEPVYRDGDVVIISPKAGIRRGDRVVVKTRENEIMAKQLRRRSAKKLELASLNPAFPVRSLLHEEVEWVARIVWASQ